jgi:glycosyltransferase involved in cell wall biosynthesis/SAM-dependent methyltransferase
MSSLDIPAIAEAKIVKCRNCSLIYVKPFPRYSDQLLIKMYSNDNNYFPELTPYMEKVIHRLNPVRRFQTARRLAKREIRNFLEIGCGLGYGLQAARKFGWQVYGQDLSPDFARTARERSGVDIVTGQLDENSFPGKKFDLIYIDSVLEHCADPVKYMKCIVNYLSPEGIIYLVLPNEDSIPNKLMDGMLRLAGAGKTSRIRPFAEPYHVLGFSQKSIYCMSDILNLDIKCFIRHYSYNHRERCRHAVTPWGFVRKKLFGALGLLSDLVDNGMNMEIVFVPRETQVKPIVESVTAPGNKLRIAVDINTLGDGKCGNETSGIQTAVIALLDQLQRLDTSNEYLLFEARDSAYKVYNNKWKKILLPRHGLSGIVWLYLVLPWYLRRYKIDVLWEPKILCPLLFFRKIRVFTTIYDLTFLHYPETMTVKDRALYRFLFPLSAKRSSAVLTDSEYIKRDFENSYRSVKTPVIAVPLGKPDWSVPADYSYRQRKEFLFFAGNLEPRKNLINAIKALEILRAQGITIELQIASPSSWQSSGILDYLSRSPVRDSIKLLGYLPVEVLKEKYLTCKALLYPSFYEGFGLPVLEALAMDCPVLTSKNTVMQEIAGESAVYFDPFDPLDIAEKIRLVYSEDFNRDSYLKHCGRVLEKYSWEKAARTMLSSFELS